MEMEDKNKNIELNGKELDDEAMEKVTGGVGFSRVPHGEDDKDVKSVGQIKGEHGGNDYYGPLDSGARR